MFFCTFSSKKNILVSRDNDVQKAVLNDSARCSFTGKEKDSETGYHYFGARYYNSDLSLWLSVDPMSDKYPSLSPYNYCAWNPMKLVDPDGMEVEYSSFADRILVFIERVFNKGFRLRFNDLKKSTETYVFNGYTEDGGSGGEFTTDGNKLYINYNMWKNEEQGTNSIVNLKHETEHAVQFEYGEIGFDISMSPNKSWESSGVNVDLYDEVKARDFGFEGLIMNPKKDNVRNSWQGDVQTKINHLSNQNGYSNWSKISEVNKNEEKIKTDSQYMLPYHERKY